MSIVKNLEFSNLDVIAIFIHTAFSCICSMNSRGPGHRSDKQRHRCLQLELSIGGDVTSREYVTLVSCRTSLTVSY